MGRSLDAIEKAIRNAFDKGDASERAFREKVYRSAFAALDRALDANPNVTPEIAARRRDALSASIAQIESEFLPAVPVVEPAVAPEPEPVPEPMLEPAPEPAIDAGPEFAPVLTREDRDEFAPGPYGYDDAAEPPARAAYRGDRRRGGLLSPLLALLVLAAIVAGAWWLFSRGPIERPPAAGQPVERPDEPPRIVGGGDGLSGWITIFDPADPTTVSTPGDSRAEVMEEDGERFIRLTPGASGAPILFDVGQGVLEEVAGRRAVFNIVARVEEGETQISVDCSLAELGDCGRKRYAVGVTREEFLFEMDLPRVDPGAGGTIAINPGIGNGGRPVDIHAIRVSPAG